MFCITVRIITTKIVGFQIVAYSFFIIKKDAVDVTDFVVETCGINRFTASFTNLNPFDILAKSGRIVALSVIDITCF